MLLNNRSQSFIRLTEPNSGVLYQLTEFQLPYCSQPDFSSISAIVYLKNNIAKFRHAQLTIDILKPGLTIRKIEILMLR